jgi:hypothetical protein
MAYNSCANDSALSHQRTNFSVREGDLLAAGMSIEKRSDQKMMTNDVFFAIFCGLSRYPPHQSSLQPMKRATK